MRVKTGGYETTCAPRQAVASSSGPPRLQRYPGSSPLAVGFRVLAQTGSIVLLGSYVLAPCRRDVSNSCAGLGFIAASLILVL